MIYTFNEASTTAQLRLLQGEKDLHHDAFADKGKPYTVAWNRGPAQTVVVDGIEHEVGTGEIILLVVQPGQQTFRFSVPETITAWQFNREFYCIVDHDKEVSCVGFIFYGLLESKRLLLYTEMDVAEVAYEVGFREASHFSRFFKKMVGEAPVVFRASA